ncbi:hypothetical protein yc1106_05129 [Curvularia clavata]|uniref:F-box domain-containing protein n=1 Tax=Curvularia clavata TaxID=95742 RepID=A0A9Q8Z9Y0_CURCL|nr:hypothetical protein yc1106_05129 [Curvularia clavata]
MTGLTNTSLDKLSALPEELIVSILDCIETDDISTLHALGGTSRRFQRLAISRLYSKFYGEAPEQFLRTIALSHPELADHVKEVVWFQTYWSVSARQRCVSPEQRLLLANKLQNTEHNFEMSEPSVDLPGRFIEFDHSREPHWWYLEFFLCFTPRVQKLTVWDTWLWDDHSYWFLTVSMNPHRFENLSSITVHGPQRIENVVPLLTLPSIRKLELLQVVAMRQELGRTFAWREGQGKSIADLLSSGSSLQQLILRASSIFFPDAIVILERLNKLKSLTYEYVDDELASHRRESHEFPRIEDLRRLSNCPLEYLRIRSESVLEREVVSSLFATRVPVLEKHPLQDLHTLDLGPCDDSSFWGTSFELHPLDTIRDPRDIAEQLPDTLEVLRIKWDEYDKNEGVQLLECLEPFARAVASASNLKRIAIADWPALGGWFPHQERFSRLQRLFRSLGMDLEVVGEEIDGEEPLVTADDVEQGWLWVGKTSSFTIYAGNS